MKHLITIQIEAILEGDMSKRETKFLVVEYLQRLLEAEEYDALQVRITPLEE